MNSLWRELKRVGYTEMRRHFILGKKLGEEDKV